MAPCSGLRLGDLHPLSSDKVGHEESLILLEDHAILNGLLLVQIVPSAIGALFAIASVFQYPVSVLVLDC